MPEAAVNEDYLPSPAEDEIRRSREPPIAQPESEPQRVGKPSHHHFRVGVPRTDAGY